MKKYAFIPMLMMPFVASAAAGVADVANEDPGLFVVMMVALLAVLFMMMTGLLVCTVIAGGILLLIGMGILSTSLVVGWYHRSFGRAISTFVLLCFIAGGGIAAGLLLFILAIFEVQWGASALFCTSIIVAGGIGAWLCAQLVKKIAGSVFMRLKVYNSLGLKNK